MTTFQRGSHGKTVEAIQKILGIDVDGDYGAATEQAVKEHQASVQLTADGVAGPDTLASLGLWDHVVVSVGSKGEVVRKVQEKLGVAIDGAFGAATKAAVVAFQKAKGIVDDGVVGAATIHHLGLIV